MTRKPIGYFTFVLHAHLPYVLAHGKWPHGMDWLNEATAETYIPILNIMNEMLEAGHTPKMSISISPVLCEQLADDSFKEEFESYLRQKIMAAINDQIQFEKYRQTNMLELARMWETYYRKILADFLERYHRDLLGEFRRLADAGYLDIITCGATHGYLPLLGLDNSVQAQVKAAIAAHKHYFGKAPRGMWLPECAYRPRYQWIPPVDSVLGKTPRLRKGVDEILSENGIEYFFVDSVLLRGGKAIGVYLDRFEALKRLWAQYEKEMPLREVDEEKSPYEIYLVSSNPEVKKPVAIFTRDPKTGLQVWSGEWGYPGDGWYLDFHKKHFPGGHRYWRVTTANSDLADKQEYHPEQAKERVPENASHFVQLIKDTLHEHYQKTGIPGVLTAPFDAELFGHWWFEGPEFLKQVMILLQQQDEVVLSHAAEVLDLKKPKQVITIPEGSWGEGGYHYIWLNEDTSWTWPHIYHDEKRLIDFLNQVDYKANPQLEEVLKQAARELMLLQASDWQFLISTWAARDYAELRITEHHNDFNRLMNIADNLSKNAQLNEVDRLVLEDSQKKDALFPQLELEWFAKLDFPV
ncbi:DUF1957 domain-containing protein [candidate division KSB1 bacterium]|nr:MAG: DUF1957 domain-containing protein [candidate division KSB1 bacterium]RKY86822.1 MAG: DUF1957 domain-containing protein [candidate division KSB1 bacterium]RKY92286.1 MAG: DUF1957 domain-containing protein [candidate division KSB1 bacterium]